MERIETPEEFAIFIIGKYFNLCQKEITVSMIHDIAIRDAAIRKGCADRAVKLQIALCYPDRKEYAGCHFCSRCGAIREAIEGEI